jgi:aspartate kinase
MTDGNRHRVLKFGGTSVGSPENLRHALSIVADAARENTVTVVVSALSGVTDQLAALAQGVGRGLDARRILAALRERHAALLSTVAEGPARRDAEIAAAPVWDGLGRDLAALAGQGQRTACDSVLAAGERLAVPIFVAGLRARGLRAVGVDGASVIRTDDGWGEAQVDFGATQALAARHLASLPRDVVPIVTGFVGGTADGRTTVLGRGGSDYTAAILGAALSAFRVDIWTDVDGILSADPHLVDGAFTLARLSYDEASALATLGAKVLHPKTIPPLALSRIPIFVGNTSRRSGEGTWVAGDSSWVENDSSSVETDSSWVTAKAVASIAVNGHARIGVLPSSQASAPHLGSRVLQVLADADLAANPGPQAEGAAVTVVVDTDERARAVRALHAALVQRGAPSLP